mgnify:CR=1 FL=1
MLSRVWFSLWPHNLFLLIIYNFLPNKNWISSFFFTSITHFKNNILLRLQKQTETFFSILVSVRFQNDTRNVDQDSQSSLTRTQRSFLENISLEHFKCCDKYPSLVIFLCNSFKIWQNKQTFIQLHNTDGKHCWSILVTKRLQPHDWGQDVYRPACQPKCSDRIKPQPQSILECVLFRRTQLELRKDNKFVFST